MRVIMNLTVAEKLPAIGIFEAKCTNYEHTELGNRERIQRYHLQKK